MSTTFPILATSLAVYFRLTSFHASKSYKVQTCFIFVELTSTVQQLRLKPWRRRRHPRKYATSTTKSMLKCISGSILGLITSGGPVLSGILALLKRSSLIFTTKTKLPKRRWHNVTVPTATYGWLIVSLSEHVLFVSSLMLAETSVTNARRPSIPPLNCRTISVISAKRHLKWDKRFISSLIFLKFNMSLKNGLTQLQRKEIGLRTRLL